MNHLVVHLHNIELYTESFGKPSDPAVLLISGELDAVPVIFNGTYNLKDLYPERTVFGLNEVIIHSYTMGCYYFRMGDVAQAEKYLEIMKQLFPEHQAVEDLEDKINLASLREVIEKIVMSEKTLSKKRNTAKKVKKHVKLK